MRKTREAFVWIIGVLRKHKVPFQITGGMAAQVYGSPRQLADIDIEIHDRDIIDILPDVQRYLVYGPKAYRDRNWKLMLMTLRYKGQLIDICGCDNEKIFDSRLKRWHKEHVVLRKAVRKKVLGLVVPVVPEEFLIEYKSALNRRVDRADIKALTP